MVVRSKVAPSLVAIRRDLEEIDRALVLLVAARVEAAGTAIRLRSQGNGRIADPAQEERVIARAEGWAEQAGLSPARMRTIFRAVVESGKERYATESGPGQALTRSRRTRRTARTRGRSSSGRGRRSRPQWSAPSPK
ncbi:MAG: chorismate mutase [Thermoplasmata archaeon]